MRLHALGLIVFSIVLGTGLIHPRRVSSVLLRSASSRRSQPPAPAPPAGSTTTIRCDVPRVGDPLVPCYREATHRVRSVCAHEHASVDDICDDCLDDLRNGRSICSPCDDSPTGAHECRRHLSSVRRL